MSPFLKHTPNIILFFQLFWLAYYLYFQAACIDMSLDQHSKNNITNKRSGNCYCRTWKHNSVSSYDPSLKLLHFWSSPIPPPLISHPQKGQGRTGKGLENNSSHQSNEIKSVRVPTKLFRTREIYLILYSYHVLEKVNSPYLFHLQKLVRDQMIILRGRLKINKISYTVELSHKIFWY